MQTDPTRDQENRKTMIYVGVALLAMVIAWEPWRRTSEASSVPIEIGKKLFSEFKDPLEAKYLEITKFDETNATIHQFLVKQQNGIWSIPSHSNYPADAREHMAQAATSLLGLEILGVASDKPGDQELYGVITPDRAKLKLGATGVGTRVLMKDDKDKVLADLVIGKDLKDQPGVRFVRKEGRDQIYRVAIKTDKLSTKFEDWIEKDLLKLNGFDIKTVELNDYSTQEVVTPQGQVSLGLNQRSRLRLVYDNNNNNWILLDMSEFDKEGKPVRVTMAEDEELDVEKLNAMKGALDELQLVDVERKPTGLSQGLRASEDFVKNREAVESLLDRGFYPASRPGQPIEIYSSEGEATCATKDGVRYILRFGNLAGGSENKSEPGEDAEKKNAAMNRYLFVMAQFDPSQIQKPAIVTVPGEEEEDADKPADEPADKPADATETKTADEAEQTPAAETTKADDSPAALPADAKPADAKPADDARPADAEVQPGSLSTPEEEIKIMIRRENKRKQEEYDDQIKKGEEKVKELNDRFADWYFVISDDVYKKIHLGRNDVVKKKAKPADEDKPADAPQELEQEVR